VFLSGCTGFLGKIILEKLFRTCPDVGTIYVMVRAKRNNKPWDRVRKEILASECFNVVKKMIPNF
jgi:thioester reductase-like protein